MAGSGMQQSTGHTAAQASCSWKPTHSVQSSGSITKMSSPWLMAWLGHSGSQAPQLMHSTVIRVDMAAVLYDGSGVAGGKPGPCPQVRKEALRSASACSGEAGGEAALPISSHSAAGIRRKAETTSGSNWVPEQREISRSEEHTSELQSRSDLVCRLLLE